MKPLPLAVAAFAAGLLPGLVLYWTSAQRPVPQQQSVAVPAPLNSASTPATPGPVTTAPTLPPAVEKKSSGKPVRPIVEATPQNIALLEQQLRERSERLTASEASLQETKARFADLEAKVAALTEQSAQAIASEKSLRQELDSASRQIASLQNDLKSRDAKVNEADAAQLRTWKLSAESSQKSVARMAELTTELEDIARRRETYLNQILSRYREATDLFRAMSLRLDNPRDAGSPLNNDLSRIQQAVQHAEEDLRQLRTLNQGSTRVLKELATARAKK